MQHFDADLSTVGTFIASIRVPLALERPNHISGYGQARILCGMRNGDHVYFAEYWKRKKHAELGIICGIKNAEKSCYSLLTFANVSTAVYCVLFLCPLPRISL